VFDRWCVTSGRHFSRSVKSDDFMRHSPTSSERRRRQHRAAENHEGVPRGDSEEGGSPSLSPINALAVPEFVERGARLTTMDVQDVEACLILPTTGVGVETQLRETPDVLYPSLRAFNRWLEEDWGFGTDGRCLTCESRFTSV